jgi:hypothetical protein
VQRAAEAPPVARTLAHGQPYLHPSLFLADLLSLLRRTPIFVAFLPEPDNKVYITRKAMFKKPLCSILPGLVGKKAIIMLLFS